MDTNTLYADTFKLHLLIQEESLARENSEIRVDYNRPKFYGHNPLTGASAVIIFNEPIPGKSRVMNWNPLTQCWFYSEDAGLTWKRIDKKEEYIQHLSKTDCLIDTEYQPGFE